MERCDCLNECGDDSRVAAGQVRKCRGYDRLQADERRRLAHTELLRELARTQAQELVCNGLAYVIREYPDKASEARHLQDLVMGYQPEHRNSAGRRVRWNAEFNKVTR